MCFLRYGPSKRLKIIKNRQLFILFLEIQKLIKIHQNSQNFDFTHKTNGFLTFLVPTRAPKGPPKDPPWLPRASSGPPRGPKKNVFWCARAPWDPVGAPGEPKRADSEDTGRPIQVGHLNSVFCYTSPVILTTFQKKCCGPGGKLANFFEKRT